jgi:small subunit ribosomal protein S17
MPKRILQGVVVSDSGDKTVLVRVDRALVHPVLAKAGKSRRGHAAKDVVDAAVGEKVWDAAIGEKVWIEATRTPLSEGKLAQYITAGKTSDGVKLLQAEVGPTHFSRDQIRQTIQEIIAADAGHNK